MFSIIIPTVNNLDYLRVCLNSLKKNSTFNNEIIVHVNIGSDGTKKFLKENNILYTFSENNLGLCKAVNLAAQKASTDYILYSHDDFYFCPKWDEVLYKEIKSINHKRFYLSSTQVNTFGFDFYNCGNNYKNFNEKKLLENLSKKKFPDLQGSTWAPHLVHRDYWIKVGGFSEEFFPGAGSDPDFAFKLWNKGIRIFKMVGDSKVYHFESKTLRDKNKSVYFNIEDLGSKSAKIFMIKWGVSTKFFKKYYLKSNSLYNGELDKPNINILFIIEFLICKIKSFYLKFIYKKRNIK